MTDNTKKVVRRRTIITFEEIGHFFDDQSHNQAKLIVEHGSLRQHAYSAKDDEVQNYGMRCDFEQIILFCCMFLENIEIFSTEGCYDYHMDSHRIGDIL
uniref:Uncharacterized protein n=1 Tax=Romanomermis culicivorax TaxID=13658 RepID=A0A915J0K2_ROMCU